MNKFELKPEWHTMQIDTWDTLTDRFQYCLKNFVDINGKPAFQYQGSGVFKFKNEEDAFIFKLRWS
jgi:hypothetical protein